MVGLVRNFKREFLLAPLHFSPCTPLIFKIPKLVLTFYLKRSSWISCFATVLLFHFSVALMAAHFSCAEQGRGVSCIAQVLVDF